MIKRILWVVAAIALGATGTFAQDDALPEGAKLIAEGFSFPEGPAIDAKGVLWFTDPRGNTIHTWDGKELKQIADDTQGGNGLAFDKEGTLYVCQGGGAAVGKLEANRTIATVVAQADQLPLASPNDLVFDHRGNLFFTNPGRRGVPSIVRAGTDGASTIVASDPQYPNGIGISPDGKWLYVCDTMGGSALWRYPLSEDGEVGEGAEFINFGRGAPDGMAVAASGNLYVAMNLAAKITVVNPEGNVIKEYQFPTGSGTTNVCFGGPDWKTLYITCGSSGKVYEMPVDEAGLVPYSHRE
jgi:gluconolactonase